MTPVLLALLLAVIVLIASVRVLRRARDGRQRGWRTALLLAGQAALAVLLYFVLMPPAVPTGTGTLIVLTAGASDVRPRKPGDQVVALPEAPSLPDVERAPDLGTALRQHPAARSLLIVGEGLAPRDRDAARSLPLSFDPAPLPTGWVALSAPARAIAGRRWPIRGRIEGGTAAMVELLDPSGAKVAQVPVTDEGRFALDAAAGAPGRVDYRLQWRDADGTVREEITLPIEVASGAPLRLWLLAGGPSPETKYLRRWAMDAGLALRTQVSVGGGVELGDPPMPVTAATLSGFDVVVLDERAWRAAGDGGRAALREAVRGGLGLVLRVTGDLSSTDRATLRDLGFELTGSDLPRSVRLPGTQKPDDAARPVDGSEASQASQASQATDTAPLLSRRPLVASAVDGVPLVLDTRGDPLAVWRAEGRGRVAVWLLSDSYRLALAGRTTAHANLWAESLEVLSRPGASPPLAVPHAARVSERSKLCGLDETHTLRAPDGSTMALAVAPADGCAAFWPTQPGWHELQAGEARAAFPVRGEDEAPGLRAAERRQATLALAADAAPAAATADSETPGRRWPWLMAWLLVFASLGWFERARFGRTVPVA